MGGGGGGYMERDRHGQFERYSFSWDVLCRQTLLSIYRIKKQRSVKNVKLDGWFGKLKIIKTRGQ